MYAVEADLSVGTVFSLGLEAIADDSILVSTALGAD
jgi:hypothetical protein